MTRTLRRLATALCLLVPGPAALRAQGFDTKFKAVGFTPGSVYHTDEGVSVSLNGGGMEASIPLGPALPGPLPLRPLLQYHGKFTQPLNPKWYYGIYRDSQGGSYPTGTTAAQADQMEKAYQRWSPPAAPYGAIHPGKLRLAIGTSGMYGEEAFSSAPISITTPLGQTSQYYDSGPGMRAFSGSVPADVSELRALMSAVAPEWPYAASWGTGSTGTMGFRTSDGSTLIFGPADHQIIFGWSTYTTTPTQYTSVPTQILQVSGDQIICWQQSRNYYRPDRNAQTVAEQWWWRGSVYHPVWIKTRSGFKVSVAVYRATPKERTDLVERGLLTGWKVSYTANGQEVSYTVDATSATPVTFQGMAGEPATTGLTLSGAMPVKATINSPGWQSGTTTGYETLGTERAYDADYVSDELGFTPTSNASITHGTLVTSFEWNGPVGLLSKLTAPNGKAYQFTYSVVQGVGVRSPYQGVAQGWTYNPASPGALDYWSVATRMDLQDGLSPATRSTTYQWAIPAPNTATGTTPVNWQWATKQQGVAQTLPDGQTILHVFASPIDPSASPTLDQQGQTFLAERQAPVARYYYAAGDTSWQSFFTGGDPSVSGWYRRERMEGFDLRGWEGTVSQIQANVEPRPTRVMSEERNGPVSVVESDAWDPARNQYQVKRRYVLAAGASPASQLWAPGCLSSSTAASFLPNPGLAESPASGAVAHEVSATTFAPAAEGLLARPGTMQEKQILAPATGAAGPMVPVQYTYDTAQGRAHVVLGKSQLASDGSAGHLDLGYTATPEGLFTVDRLKAVSLSGAAPNQAATGSLSGQVGAAYSYGGTVDGAADATGRFMTQIQPSGVAWTEQEPAHDGLGRALSQVDPDGRANAFTWDALGRLTASTPPSPEVGTTIGYPTFGGLTLREATVTRGAAVGHVYYNGFGELIGEDRLGAGGAYSHKLYGYDPAGRKTFESVWRSGAFTTTQANDWMTTGQETTSAGGYVNTCVAWAVDKDTGERTCTQYQMVYYPGTTTAVAGTTWAYDTRGRLVTVTNANGETVDTQYEIGGNPLVTQSVVAKGTPRQTITTFERDTLGRLVKVTDALGQVTTYAYDAAGRIAQAVQADASGHAQTRSWVYDGLGRLVVLDQPESGVTYYTSFTVTGKATETVYGLARGWRPADVNGRDGGAFTAAGVKVLTATYDALSRPTAVTGPGVSQSFTYDTAPGGKGRLASANAGGVTRSLEYSGLNGRLSKLTRTVDGLSFVQSYGYDTYGKLTSRTYPDGRAQALTYDDARSLPTATTVNGASLLTLGYDPTSWAPVQMTYANGATSSFTYRTDQVGLKTMAHAIPGQTGLSWSFQYDERGQLTTDGEDTYSYDALDRLTSAFVRDPFNANTGQGILQQFSYDAYGNRLSLNSKTVTNWAAGAAPPALPATTTTTKAQTYGFDANDAALWSRNQLPTATVLGAPTGAAYDAQGNLTTIYQTLGLGGTQLTMTYDGLGRVTTLGDTANATSQSYGYDDEGLRIKITDSATGKVRYNLYNEARQMIATYEKPSGGSLTWKKDILYVGVKEITEIDATSTSVTFVDHLGSPRLSWAGSGMPIKQKFLPFGETLSDPTSAAKFAKGFTNHEQTDASGLIYMQARFYLSQYGRFASPDPARDQYFEITQSWNIYSYVRNSPTMQTDPTGMVVRDLTVLSRNLQSTRSFMDDDWSAIFDNAPDPGASSESGGAEPASNGQTSIMVDPGHGDHNSKNKQVDPGALSSDGKVYEKDVALNIANGLQAQLTADGYQVHMTRTGDYDSPGSKPLEWRVQASKDNAATIFVSIHLNSAASPSAGGFTVIYGNDLGKALGQKIVAAQSTMPLAKRSLLNQSETPHQRLYVLNAQRGIPAVLIEAGYLTNSRDLGLLTTKASQIGREIGRGIESYINQ